MTEASFKGYWHAAVATAVGVMVGYNAMRWVATRQRRHAVNLLVYVPLTLFEWRQAAHHWRNADR